VNTLNKTKLITVICWAISALALSGLLVWLLLSNVFGGIGLGFEPGLGRFDVVATHRVPADNIDNLDIDWTSGRVTIGTHSGDEIIITELSRRDLRENEALWFNADDGTLTIRFVERTLGTRIGNMPTKQLEVLIPSRNFDHFHVSTVSGRIVAGHIQSTDFSASTISGRIELDRITAEHLSATTTSGRIELRDITAQTIDAATTSGRINVLGTETQSLRTHTISGRHELLGSFGEVDARSTSGRLVIVSQITPERVVAQTTSGRIELTVPREGTVGVQYSTRSGRFTSELPITTQSGADAQFNLSTGSGRISIFELRR